MCPAGHPLIQRLVTVTLLAALLFGCSGREPEPGDRCSTLADCVGEQPLSCSQNQCARLSCERSAECPAGAACVAGICQAAECQTTDDCKNRQRCWEGDCRSDICDVKAECDAEQVCIGEPPTCKLPPARCEEDADCPQDTFCMLPEQRCEPKCASDAACLTGAYCDGEFCRPRCSSSSDCGEGDRCVEGRCEPDECGDRTCPDTMPFVDPASCECVACLSDRDCPIERGERCSGALQCVFCLVEATSSEACTNQGLYLQDGCCVECLVDPHCADGFDCLGGRCVPENPRECDLDSDCLVGQRCDLGWCVVPGSGLSCERQPDCDPSEACYSDGFCRPASDVCVDCSEPGRCVAEPGDDVGTCAGCTTPCDSAGCPDGTTCAVPEGQVEGYCARLELTSCP